MAQPWALIAGITVSVLIGIATIHSVLASYAPHYWAIVLGDVLLRCQQPPAAEVALIVVMAWAVYGNLAGKR